MNMNNYFDEIGLPLVSIMTSHQWFGVNYTTLHKQKTQKLLIRLKHINIVSRTMTSTINALIHSLYSQTHNSVTQYWNSVQKISTHRQHRRQKISQSHIPCGNWQHACIIMHYKHDRQMVWCKNGKISDFARLYLCNKTTSEQITFFLAIQFSSILQICSECSMSLQLWKSSGNTHIIIHIHVHR